MRIRSLLALSALLTALAVSAPAQAQTYAYAAGDGYTNMRAGPGTRYPTIARIAPGSRVYVLGCIVDHSWCEGVVQGVQGWMHAQRLEFLYAGRRVLVPSYYAYFGAPIISFRFDDYDDDYYDDWRPRHRRPHWRPPHHNPPHDGGGYTNWKPPSMWGQGGGQVIDGGGGVVGAGPGVSGGGSGGMPSGGGGEGFIPPSGGGFGGGGGGGGFGGGGGGGACPIGVPC
jgi:uncharacterized protein YraI